MIKAPRGTRDILPPEQEWWQYVRNTATEVSSLYAYAPIDTPLIEEARLFQRSVGEGTDVVEKEMYTFTDRGGNELTLKPEGTAPVCRAYLEHGLRELPQPVRLYYFTPAYRYERPQSGRQREHHQFGCEAIGEADYTLDAEVISLACTFFDRLGISRVDLVINSIGCPECRPGYTSALKEYYEPHRKSLCPDCKRRLERNPLRLLDCKNSACQGFAANAPRSLDYLCAQCRTHFNGLTDILTATDTDFVIDHRLVRGLDYYTRTVFEVHPEGSTNALGGGGRYDNLIQSLGGPPTPGVGFACGIERTIEVLQTRGIRVPALPAPRVFLAYVDRSVEKMATRLAQTLRQEGIGVIFSTSRRSLKSQLRQANARNASYCLILGEEEIERGVVVMRDLISSRQQEIALEGLLEELKRRVA